MDQATQNGTIDLNARINNPDTAAALNRLLDRIDALEQTVTTLTNTIQQAPGLIAMTGDMVDNAYRDAADRGVNLEERAAIGLQLLEKLTEPKTAMQLQQLLDLADQAPGLVAMTGDIVDGALHDAAALGVDLNARLSSGLHLLNRLTDPKMTAQLEQLMDMADQAPGFIAMAGDIVDDSMGSAMASGFDLQETFATLGTLGKAITEAQKQPIKPVGALGMVKAMGDPNVQRAMGMLMNIAQQIGKTV